MRLLRTVGRPRVVGPVVQRNLGVWLALTLIAVIVGLDWSVAVTSRDPVRRVPPDVVSRCFGSRRGPPTSPFVRPWQVAGS